MVEALTYHDSHYQILREHVMSDMEFVKVPWDLSVRCDFARSKSLLLDKISSDY